MFKKTKSLGVFSLASLAMISVYASSAYIGVFTTKIEPSLKIVRVAGSHQEVVDLIAKYKDLSEYKSPTKETIDAKFTATAKFVPLINGSSNDKMLGEFTSLLKKLLAEVETLKSSKGDEVTAQTLKNEETGKKIDLLKVKVEVDKTGTKDDEATLKLLTAEKTAGDEALIKLQGEKEKAGNAQISDIKLLDKGFFGEKLKEDIANATLDNFVLDQSVEAWQRDVKYILTKATEGLKGVAAVPEPTKETYAEISNEIDPLLKALKQFEEPGATANKALTTFGKVTFGEATFEEESKNLTNQIAASQKLVETAVDLWTKAFNKVLDNQAVQIAQHLQDYDSIAIKKIKEFIEADRKMKDQLQSMTSQFAMTFAALGSNITFKEPPQFKKYARRVTMAEDWLEGTLDDTVLDQVRLFYYPNAMNIAQALRPGEKFEQANPNAEAAQNKATEATNKLRTLESKILQLNAERNELQSQVLTIRTDIQNLNLDIAAKAIQVTATKGVYDSQDREVTVLQRNIDDKQKQIDKETDDGKKQTLTTEKTALERQKADKEKERDATKQEQTALETEKTGLETQRAKLTEAQGDLPAKLAQANTDLQTKAKALREQRLTLPGVASDEIESFGELATNEPVYIALGFRGLESSARRVRFIVYPRSKVIILRGPRADVTRVKDMIALFDRPTPQARITLHTLQVNGNDPRKVSKAISEISNSLRDAKTNMGIVQETLKNAIAAEVQRCEHAARLWAKDHSVEQWGTGTYYRAQIYSPEVQSALGMEEIDYQEMQIKRGMVDVRDLANLIGEASAELRAALEYKLGATKLPQSKANDAKRNLMEEAEQKTMMRFRLIATRAAYVAGDVLSKLSEFPDLQNEISKIFSTKEHICYRCGEKSINGVGFKNIFDQSYKLVRSDDLDVTKVIQQYIDRYAEGRLCTKCCQKSAHSTDLSQMHNTMTVELDKLTKGLIDTLQVIYSTLESKNPCRPKSLAANRFYLYGMTVPDPAKITTLGEMLFVMSLTKQRSRERILHDFAEELYYHKKILSDGKKYDDMFNFAVATINQFGNQARNQDEFQLVSKSGSYPIFPRVVFGANPFAGAGADSSWTKMHSIAPEKPFRNYEMSANQLEILYGLRAKVRRNVASELRRFSHYIVLDKKIVPQQQEVINYAVRLLNLCEGDYQAPKNCQWEVYSRRIEALAQRLEESESLSTATPRVAAADQMIKRFMEAFETDFDKFFVSPMIDRIREATSTSGIQFGSYERKSILASNRLLSKVEISGTANVQVGQQQDILAESATLLSLLNTAKNPPSNSPTTANTIGSAISDGVTTSIIANAGKQSNPNSLLQYGAIGGVLSALLSTKADINEEIYSIGTGGAFKVIPIFNPSGQGLTFRLDYAQATRVLEPNGTTNLQSPRIDRISTGTDVQVTNLDLEAVTSFDSNYKLGRPEKSTGGIPILRDLLPDVPIIGWFTRSKEIKPVRQSSLVFVQTAMYPTVGDIMDLLVWNPTGGRFLASGAPDFSDPSDKETDK